MGDGAPRALGSTVSGTEADAGIPSPSVAIADADIRKIAGAALRALPAPGFIKDAVREELVQALRVEAGKYVPGPRSISTHLTVMARYRAIQFLRVRSREQAHNVSLEELTERGATDSPRLARRDGGFGEVEFWDAVERALNAEQARLLDLLLTGASQSDIARALNVDKRRLSERVKKLRVILATALFGGTPV